MEVSTKGAGPIWKVVFLSVLGLAAVGGMMYMLFTDEAYDGYGGKNTSEDVVVSTNAAKADSIAKAAHAREDSQKTAQKSSGSSAYEAAKPMESNSVPVSKPVEVKPQPVPAAPVVAKVETPKPVVVTPKPVVVAPAPKVAKPAPTASLVAKTSPPPSVQPATIPKPQPNVVAKPAVVSKPVVTAPKPAPAVAKASTPATVKSTPSSSTSSHTSTAPTAKPTVKKEDKVLSNEELQKMVSDVLAKGNEAGIYAKCVQLRNTVDGNNTTTMKQIESYFRSQKFVIGGRETVSAHVKGYSVAAGDGCLKLTVGSF